jgi:glycerol-3-phosphate dehydrogenase
MYPRRIPLLIRTHSPTDIEAEVRYAVHNEYAATAIDFLARRSRLTFLNSNAALDALPRVVEIMGDELGWSKRRRNMEIRDAEIFMESMGVPFGARRYRVGWREWAANWAVWLGRVIRGGSGAAMDDEVIAGAVRHAASISRAQFDPGEIDRLKASFTKRVPAPSIDKETRWISIEDARTLVDEKINLGW